jgi:predicted PurR-regulated permease PerM
MARKRKNEEADVLFGAAHDFIILFLLSLLIAPVILIIGWIYFTRQVSQIKRRLAIGEHYFDLSDDECIKLNNRKTEFQHVRNLMQEARQRGIAANLSINQDGSFSAHSNLGKSIRAVFEKYEPIKQTLEMDVSFLENAPYQRQKKFSADMRKKYACQWGLWAWMIAFCWSYAYSLLGILGNLLVAGFGSLIVFGVGYLLHKKTAQKLIDRSTETINHKFKIGVNIFVYVTIFIAVSVAGIKYLTNESNNDNYNTQISHAEQQHSLSSSTSQNNQVKLNKSQYNYPITPSSAASEQNIASTGPVSTGIEQQSIEVDQIPKEKILDTQEHSLQNSVPQSVWSTSSISFINQPDIGNGQNIRNFDCSQVQSVTTYLICHDPELVAVDHDFSIIYRQAEDVLTDKDALTQRLIKQLKYRDNHCQDKDCLMTWYAYETRVYKKIIETGDVAAQDSQ